MRRSRSASTDLPEMLVKCVPYAARWLSPRDFLRVFVDQGAPGSTARHLCCTQLLSLPFSLRFALSRSRPHMTASRSLSAVSPASAPHRA